MAHHGLRPPIDEAKVVALYLGLGGGDPVSVSSIAKRYDRNSTQISEILRRHGVAIEKKRALAHA